MWKSNDQTHVSDWCWLFHHLFLTCWIMCFQGLENLVEHHFEGTWKQETWQIFFVERVATRGPDRFWIVFLCPMLDATMGGFMEEMDALHIIVWLSLNEFDDVWIVCIFSNISVLEFSEGVILGSSSLSQKLGSCFVHENLWPHPVKSHQGNSVYAWQDKMDGTDRHRLPWSVLFYAQSCIFILLVGFGH